LNENQIKEHCKLNSESIALLRIASDKMKLSARSYTRIKKIARTIADLNNDSIINPSHIAEAIQYRTLDKMSKFLN